MTRLRALMIELALGLAAATAVCALALQYDLRSALDGFWTAHPHAPTVEYSVTALRWEGACRVCDISDSGRVVGMTQDATGFLTAAVLDRAVAVAHGVEVPVRQQQAA